MDRAEFSLVGRHGTDIVYDVWTPDAEITGLVVLSHGLGEHARRYDHVAAVLGDLGLVVYAIDHRGHGRSGGKRLESKSWSDYVSDLHELFRIARAAHPNTKTFLLGHSMGGAIALSYALEHQAELDGLMLSGPAVVLGDGTPKILVPIGKILGRIAPSVPVQALDSADVSRDPAVVAAYDADPLVHHGKVPAGLASHLVGAMDSFPAALPSLTLPVLLQHGSEDKLADVAGSRMIAERAGSTDLTLEVYDGLFHEVFNEPEREQVLADLVAWLAPRVNRQSGSASESTPR
ncbi:MULTISPECIES: alpha/beta hydrolase [Nocardiaceae]|uniref:alpha/beta hydrolase n=1 Tax=Nocardiaceae TaxID=85025 RepID=UPI000565E28A|nr:MULTISPECIES: alpha/beta hydrolase [Rhodococcus]OZD70979.1 alpha/beta hydrolase [Rhodococcus sp. 06-1059B-a]OZF06710.1 alpha/beta hydrolase [Rhodococcus sp. 15-1154-1]OZF50438.1 alpha/beta hydrolase [Rhodococcus sp. 14-2470-1a]